MIDDDRKVDFFVVILMCQMFFCYLILLALIAEILVADPLLPLLSAGFDEFFSTLARIRGIL